MRGIDGEPHVLKAGHAQRLQRLRLYEDLDEDWLQGVLHQTPELLPVEEIDAGVRGPLYSLGREVGAEVGAIDNLFISANGVVVVVETKLWRNPEARRTVVSQILDYAVVVRTWRYDNLIEIAQKRANLGTSLWAAVDPEGCDEARWIDQVNRNLACGRILLLIVGDGIRTEVEALTDLVSRHPDLHYKLALVEMRVYDLGDEQRLVVPSTLARTELLERAVVTVRTETGSPIVEVTAAAADTTRKGIITAEDLFAYMQAYAGPVQVRVGRKLLAIVRDPLKVVWKTASFAIQSPRLSLFVSREGYIWTWLPDVETRDDFVGVIAGFGATPTKSGEQYNLPLEALDGSEDRFMEALHAIA